MRRLVVFTFILWLAAAVPALGSHRPSPRARAQMNAAVRRSHFMPPPIRHGQFHLAGARISSRGPWAKATVEPTGSLKHRLDSVLAIFRRHGAGWRVVQVGTVDVGCSGPRLPGKVRRDLGLSCLSARRHLHRWLQSGFPHEQTGWYCEMSSPHKLCSLGNGAAPYVTFRLRG